MALRFQGFCVNRTDRSKCYSLVRDICPAGLFLWEEIYV